MSTSHYEVPRITPTISDYLGNFHQYDKYVGKNVRYIKLETIKPFCKIPLPKLWQYHSSYFSSVKETSHEPARLFELV